MSEVEVDQERKGKMTDNGEVVIEDKKWKTSSDDPPPPPSPQQEEEVRKTSSGGTVVPPTASREDPEVIKTVEEFEKAAIAQIDDEEYWDDLMERGKLLRLIETPFQAPIGDDLFGSIRKNKIDQVEKLLQGGEDPNQRNANGSYGMHFACIGNLLSIAKLLRKHGATTNVFNKAGLTPLHCSCDVSSSIKLCNWLVAEGADVNARSQTGKTPLHCCCLQGFNDIAQWLLHKGARISEETEDGTQAIHFACHSGNLSLVQLLVEHGAQLGCVNNSGETPFMWACASGHLDIVLFMQQKCLELVSKGGDADEVEGGCIDPLARGVHGHNALHYATQGGHIDVVVQLVQQMGLDVNSLDAEHGTPLHGACLKGFLPVVEYLVDTAGADINLKTTQGVSVLHRACDGGNVEVLEYLCDKGMVPSERDVEKRTPLHYAAYRGHIHIIEWILDNFENSELILKSSNMRGSNCLHIACQKGQFKLAKYLVAHGVPINGQNNTGNTPFHFACENGHIKLAKWLSENGANLWV